MKTKNINFQRKLPYLLLSLFAFICFSIAGFVYFNFNRKTDEGVITEAKAEIQEVQIKFNSQKILDLFDHQPDFRTLEIPENAPKNPFVEF